MLDRIVALFALSLAFVVGSLFVAAQYSVAEPPSPSVPGRPGDRAGAASLWRRLTAAAPQLRRCADAPAPAGPAPDVLAPVVTAPPAQEPAPAPVVSTPPAATPAPVVTVPAEPTPAPVVTAPAEAPRPPRP